MPTKFDTNGKILQDIVNELGTRLDYDVTNGRYQGSQNSIGNDGLWLSPEGHHILVEVKTTDAYSISLDTIAKYRNSLHEQDQINDENSMLLVVGRFDTGQLEAQVRGSRHAWDMRLISVDSLVNMVKLKESTEDDATSVKIRSILVPMEYTRLDNLIDIVFTATQDVETSVESDIVGDTSEHRTERKKYSADVTESGLIDQKRNDILRALSDIHGVKLIKKTRASYWSSDRDFRVACSVSKRYAPPGDPYWFGYNGKWRDFIVTSKVGYFVLGCMDLDVAFAIPAKVMETKLEDLGTTVRPKDMWWHIVVRELENKDYLMICSKTGNHLDITPFKIALN